jgi:anti-sigma B factor antagonist
MAGLIINTRRHGSDAVVHLTGELGPDDAETLRRCLRSALRGEDPYVVADLREVTIASPHGPAVLIAHRRFARSRGGDLSLVRGPRPEPAGPEALLREPLFTIHPDIDTALAAGPAPIPGPR